MLEASLHPAHTYADPNIETAGYGELSAYMTEFQKTFAGGRFETSAFEVHHGQCLAHWNLVRADGDVVAKGASYGRFGADGRLVQMVGFQQ
ncbi:nuclear transport factor 2 family protein [Bradyrhizobium sp. HKCCYLS20291]|uniref:nuclear transport factor 2 family protein n=1 Tax=Bradyrhizobium sp. HKCCYLS20291 TaxID=3420766 RepID=UPI003EB9607C